MQTTSATNMRDLAFAFFLLEFLPPFTLYSPSLVTCISNTRTSVANDLLAAMMHVLWSSESSAKTCHINWPLSLTVFILFTKAGSTS